MDGRLPGQDGSPFLHVVQHSEGHGLSRIAELPFKLKVHRSDLDFNVPRLGNAAGLVIMGGPQTAFSDEDFQSRRGELRLIREALDQGVPILAICLGAQLLTIALGGQVYRRQEPEDGWFRVKLTTAGQQDRLFEGCPAVFTPRSHHRDSFILPAGAIRIGSSERCSEQGFRVGEHVWGTQFHFETMAGGGRSTDRDYSPEEIEHVERSIAMLEPIARRIFQNFAHVVSEFADSREARTQVPAHV